MNNRTFIFQIVTRDGASVFNGKRLQQVRELRGMSRAELAERIDELEMAIVLAEEHDAPLADATVEKIAFVTQFPVAFFYRPDPPDMPKGSLVWH